MKEQFFGVQVNTEGYKELINELFSRLNKKEKSFIVAINPEKLMKAKEDPKLRSILNTATFQIPDGIGVIIASKLQKGNIKERVTGIDMMEQLCQRASETGNSIFLYGAKPGIAQTAAQNLVQKYPMLKIAGILDGYEKDQETIIQSINDSGASILFVAMGSPKQEEFIIREMPRLNPSIYQGVGGSLDVFAGVIERAPVIFQKFGLEWFYRLMKEPSRWKRQLILPMFLLTILREKRTSDGFKDE
jgi:N-acetylglucosaminyldiphosphoundecaprenol N-acetyl-beta-D-mannosaminyltransferase